MNEHGRMWLVMGTILGGLIGGGLAVCAADLLAVDDGPTLRFAIADTGAARVMASSPDAAVRVTQSSGGPGLVVLGGGVGIGTATPNPSSALEVASSRPILFPRLTTAQRDALAPARGMVLYNTTSDALEVHDGSQWLSLGAAPPPLLLLDDFSSDGWTHSHANLSVSGGELNWDTEFGGGQVEFSHRDIGLVSDTAFTQQFRLDIDALASGSLGSAKYLFIGLAADALTPTAPTDFVGIRFTVTDGGQIFYYVTWSNGASIAAPTGTQVFTTAPTIGTVYFQIRRTTATSVTVGIYSDPSYATPVEQQAAAIPAGIQSLRHAYLGVRESADSDHTSNGSIDDMRFEND